MRITIDEKRLRRNVATRIRDLRYLGVTPARLAHTVGLLDGIHSCLNPGTRTSLQLARIAGRMLDRAW